jgi:HK97 family phage major capsid protein
MLSRTEKHLRAVKEKMEEHGNAAGEIIDKAASEDRDRTEDENADIAQHQKAIKVLRQNKEELEAQLGVENEIAVLGRKIGVEDAEKSGGGEPERPKRAKSLGAQFVESDGYKRVREKGFSGKWNTGMIELDTKTTLVEGDNVFLTGGTPGEAAALIPIEQRPGVMPILFERLTVRDLFAGGTINSNAYNYVVETVATSGAAVVPEGGLKPESTLEFENVQEPVKKIATFLTVSDETLEDAAAIQSYINARLSLFVRLKEEEELLHGAGGSNFLGLEPRIPSANKFVSSDADTPNAADHIYAAITVVRNAFLEPDGIIIHPDDWADLRLLKDDNANYIGGSPFSNTGSNPGESLWGKRVVVTQSCIPGQAVVGAFATAGQVLQRGGLSVEATNSHDTNFAYDLTAIRCEQREVLAVYRPEAFAIADLGGAS